MNQRREKLIRKKIDAEMQNRNKPEENRFGWGGRRRKVRKIGENKLKALS